MDENKNEFDATTRVTRGCVWFILFIVLCLIGICLYFRMVVVSTSSHGEPQELNVRVGPAGLVSAAEH